MEQQIGKGESGSIGGYPDTLIEGRFMVVTVLFLRGATYHNPKDGQRRNGPDRRVLKC